jgi:hypothetical protein
MGHDALAFEKLSDTHSTWPSEEVFRADVVFVEGEHLRVAGGQP